MLGARKSDGATLIRHLVILDVDRIMQVAVVAAQIPDAKHGSPLVAAAGAHAHADHVVVHCDRSAACVVEFHAHLQLGREGEDTAGSGVGKVEPLDAVMAYRGLHGAVSAVDETDPALV